MGIGKTSEWGIAAAFFFKDLPLKSMHLCLLYHKVYCIAVVIIRTGRLYFSHRFGINSTNIINNNINTVLHLYTIHIHFC